MNNNIERTYEEQIKGKKAIVDFYGNIWYNDVVVSRDLYIGCFYIVNIKYEVYYSFGDMYVKCKNKICRVTFIDKSNTIVMKAYEVWYAKKHQKKEEHQDG